MINVREKAMGLLMINTKMRKKLMN